MKFNIFKKSKEEPKSWENLSNEQKQLVTSKLSKIIKAMSGPRYKLVSGTDVLNRERGITETGTEDDILGSNSRGQLLDLARNAVRNNSTFNTILKQFELNVTGGDAGKVICSFADNDFSKQVREQFASWTRQPDFFDGLSLNQLLRIILKSQIIGGDYVLIFDDGLIKNSGKILLYESDEINNTTEEALIKRYGKNAKQSLGRVYDDFGRFVGAVVSKNQRGEQVFNPDKSYLLKRNPDADYLDELWIMPRSIYRIKQGRGISPITSSLGTIIDLQDYLNFEIQASKKNALTLGIVQEEKDNDIVDLPSTFDGEDIEKMTDDEIQKLVESQNQITPTMTLDAIRSAGAIYQTLPSNYKFNLLDTKRPNVNSIDFVRFLQQLSASPFGLARCYSSLVVDASYSAFKGEMVLSWQAFKDQQKQLEQILDWIFYRWTRWAIKNGIIENKFENNFMRSISWCWNKPEDIDQVKEQSAINLKLKNGTSTLRDILGSDWKEKLEQVSEELMYCKEKGIPHPMLQTVSGQIIETSTDDEKKLKISNY